MICVTAARQTGHSLWKRNVHSLQATKCLYGINKVSQTRSLQMLRCMRCWRLFIRSFFCCCVSIICAFEKYWSILQRVSWLVNICWSRT